MKKIELAYINKFENLNYEKFKQMALDPSLLPHEKVGFPDTYRQGKEPLIWQDICSKMTNLAQPNKLILDIGAGCSALPLLLLNQAQGNNSKVILCDSQEMLAQLPDGEQIEKVKGPFPSCWPDLSQYAGIIDTIIVYSVFHYVFGEEEQYLFFDHCLDLLAHGGQLLIGDLPNDSKRVRFFQSPAGIEFHQKFTAGAEMSTLADNTISKNKLDDLLIVELIKRARQRGFDAYVLPQADDLPMANRREDILVVRP